MTLIEGWLPPSRENWELINWLWQLFPLFTLLQWVTDFYPQGKTSITSRLNIPGKIGWFTMEAPGFLLLLYIMYSLPKEIGLARLPGENWLMASLFTIHYLYRAVLAPLVLNPSMSRIHLLVWVLALGFQLINATCIGGWLAGYGPTTTKDWEGKILLIEVGMMIFAAGLMGNIYHDDELREIRRAAAREQERKSKENQAQGKLKEVDKVYKIPQNGLFRVILYPHYLCEWIEWCGFWIIGGYGCVPARSFVLNEIATMTPRALMGRRWYVHRFGKEKVGNRKAVLPGIL